MKTYFELKEKFEKQRELLEEKKLICLPLSDIEDFSYYCQLVGITIFGGSLITVDNSIKAQYIYC